MKNRTELPKKKGLNLWKWAFIALLAIVIAFGIFFRMRIANTPVPDTQSQITTTKASSVDVKLNKEQLNALMAAYLKPYQSNKDFSYQLKVNKQVLLIGKVKVLGSNVNYALSFTPKVQSSGNIVLTAKHLAVGALSISPKLVLDYINSNYNLPKWISIKDKVITLNLQNIKTANGVYFKAKKLDIKNDKFIFLINIPKQSN
ncbi:YfaA [Pediococcus damnosus]|uniref:YfaA n=1 Tax=Pediococcus damnosus TaxID=51663 RepID=A0AAC9FI96_9LACO|nr:YpmS family protein [Pediococcus damnosus]AMV61543.1 YfaA [Pediococcus damnosus]AMV62092.1 YfaA [Pediococcus damnosus]AMV65906.1 YfaA [Pediococcus damnosus]AMV68057.1 YfaA [Pediococcus damnosus]AMV70241.1 YfaA [Pediococcus damnosus]